MRAFSLVDHVVQDGRFAVRQLRKSPAFTLTAIFTLALGLCASVAIFAFVDAALIKPLPYPNPGRLVGVYESVQMFPQSNLSYLDYLDWKKLNTSFSSLSAYQRSGATLTTPGGAQQAPAARVSDDFFRTLGVVPSLGRDFLPGEDLPGAPRTVILSHGAWKTRYDGRPDIVGSSVTLNGDPHVIVGVLPEGFHFALAEPADFWTTLHAASGCYVRRSCHNLYGVARLRDGVSVESALANVTAIARQLEAQYPDSNRGQGAAILTLSNAIVGNIRPLLLVLLAGATLLMVMAGVNVAGLLLVRSESRRREVAVRQALGATAWRVVRQFITEGLLLVAVGGVLGVASAVWAGRALAGLIPATIRAGMPFLQNLGPNPRVLLFARGVAAAAAGVFAATPLLHLLVGKAPSGLADASRGSAGVTWRRLGSRLVVVELATAMVLLVGAGLLGKSLYRLLNVDMGLQAERLATLRVALPGAYATTEQRAQITRRIESRIAELPGVQSVGVSSVPPLRGGNTVWLRVLGRPYHGEHNEVLFRDISPGYFSALQARLLRGRNLAGADDTTKPPVAVINRAMVRQYFPGEDPLGQHIQYAPTSTQPPMEIVGIVDDVKENALDAATPPAIYLPVAQDGTSNFTLFARTQQMEQSALPAMTAAIHEVDPGISTYFARPMRQIVNESQAAYVRRSSAWLVGCFAAVAWVLAVVGIYGVVAYSVSQRTREIGVRMALGAERASIYQLVRREAGLLAAMGVGLGVLAAVSSTALMQGLLFGVTRWDVPTLATVATALAASAVVASYVPARRAATISPVEALRAE